jgi:hypothetical protein
MDLNKVRVEETNEKKESSTNSYFDSEYASSALVPSDLCLVQQHAIVLCDLVNVTARR